VVFAYVAGSLNATLLVEGFCGDVQMLAAMPAETNRTGGTMNVPPNLPVSGPRQAFDTALEVSAIYDRLSKLETVPQESKKHWYKLAGASARPQGELSAPWAAKRDSRLPSKSKVSMKPWPGPATSSCFFEFSLA
jgi:hypothetical protein